MPSRAARAAFALCVALACAACGGERRWPVLLITVEALRPDYLGSGGYDRPTSPFMDSLIAEGASFEHALVPVARTTPSLASLLTGAYPHTTGVRTLVDRLAPEQVTLAEALGAAGYRTVAVVNNRILVSGRGLSAGFDAYDGGLVRDARETNGAVLESLSAADGPAPLFLWVHYFEPHTPYDPDGDLAARFDPDYRGAFRERFGREPRPGEPATRFRQFPNGLTKADVVHRNLLPPEVNAHVRRLYAAEIRSLDDRMRELVEALRARHPDLVIVLTADHGESLGEHDFYFDHGEYVYDAAGRVPLVFVLPPSHPWHGPRRCAGSVSLVDVAPTLLELVGVAPPPEMAARFEGRSLAACLRGEPLPSEPVFLESGASLFPDLVQRRVRHDVPGRFRAVVADGWKLIWTPFAPERRAWELYDLARDPGETRNLYAPDHPEVARLRPLLKAWLARQPPDEAGGLDVSEEDEAALRFLGYIE
jgi:arylsulfatase A-like enzyme